MRDWSIHREVVIESPIDTVWAFIGEPELTSQWWCTPPTVKLEIEQREGGHFEEHYNDGAYSYEIEGTVLDFDPPHRILIRRLTEGSPATNDQIDIVLSKVDSGTQVTLNHSFENLPVNRRKDMEEFYADGWSQALCLLREMVLESDRG